MKSRGILKRRISRWLGIICLVRAEIFPEKQTFLIP